MTSGSVRKLSSHWESQRQVQYTDALKHVASQALMGCTRLHWVASQRSRHAGQMAASLCKEPFRYSLHECAIWHACSLQAWSCSCCS